HRGCRNLLSEQKCRVSISSHYIDRFTRCLGQRCDGTNLPRCDEPRFRERNSVECAFTITEKHEAIAGIVAAEIRLNDVKVARAEKVWVAVPVKISGRPGINRKHLCLYRQRLHYELALPVLQQYAGEVAHLLHFKFLQFTS